jgi:Ca2+-transporting ATPase
LLPLQILFLNLVTDVFPAFALGVGAGDDDVLARPPRDPSKPILTRSIWAMIVAGGLAITAATLGGFVLALEWLMLEGDAALTVSFLILALAQLWHVFSMRDPRAPLFRNDIVRNPYIWAALAGCVALLLIAVYTPFLAGALHLSPLDARSWGLVIGLSLAPVVAMQVAKFVVVRVRD